MKKEFVPYEQALELKELGFNVKCYRGYDKNQMLFYSEQENGHILNYSVGMNVSAPLYQQAFRWFRDEHLLEGLILPQVQSMLAPTPAYFIAVISYKDEKWEEKFNSSNDKDEKNFLHYGTYEEAELACLRKLIQIVKERKS